MKRIRSLMLLAFALAALPALATAQERGTVSGRVVNAGTGQPLANVQVSLVGTTLGALTDAQGRFTIRNVPAGPQELRVNRLGFGAADRRITVAPGAATTADFTLSESAIALDEIVVTGTAGATSRRKQPAVVATVNAAEKVDRGVAASVQDLLTASVPGVT